jgi:glutaredoxin
MRVTDYPPFASWPSPALWHGLAFGLAALAVSLPADAQFKVVAPDGSVTYTDRAPAGKDNKVSALTSRPTAAATEVALPLDLRQAANRYPVTLYTTDGHCEPCDSARQLLRKRGIPYAERLVQTAEDGEALQRLSGGRDAPTLTIGGQTLRGLATEVWHSYLDSAGYPRDSRLPASYQFPTATPLTERRDAGVEPPRAAAPRAAASAAPAEPVAPPTATATSTSTIKF